MKKELYEPAELEIIAFQTEDVIATSGSAATELLRTKNKKKYRPAFQFAGR